MTKWNTPIGSLSAFALGWYTPIATPEFAYVREKHPRNPLNWFKPWTKSLSRFGRGSVVLWTNKIFLLKNSFWKFWVVRKNMSIGLRPSLDWFKRLVLVVINKKTSLVLHKHQPPRKFALSQKIEFAETLNIQMRKKRLTHCLIIKMIFHIFQGKQNTFFIYTVSNQNKNRE